MPDHDNNGSDPSAHRSSLSESGSSARNNVVDRLSILSSEYDRNDDQSLPESAGGEGERGEDAGRSSPVLARLETKAVRRLRVLLLFLLLGAAAAVAACAYLYTRRDEVGEFRETFSEYSQQIVDTVDRNAQHKLEAVGALALQFQSYAIDRNLAWPFVTMPFFEEHVMASKSLLDAYGVLLFPVVSNEDRSRWEEYSVQNRNWINASYDAQRHVHGVDGLVSEVGEDAVVGPDVDWFNILFGPDFVMNGTDKYNPPDFSAGISSSIFRTRDYDDPSLYNLQPDARPGPYFPQWQTAPMGWYYQSTVNLNYGNFDDFYQQTQVVNETQSAAFGMAWTDSTGPGRLSTMLYPIFDRFHHDSVVANDGGGEDQQHQQQRQVVAMLAIDIWWEAFLQKILPPNSDNGIYVVIENTHEQVFTYEIFGEEAQFIGESDLHERQYDYMKRSFVFGSNLMEPISSPDYTGPPLVGEFYGYTFHLYPSQQMEVHYVTSRPILYAVVACLIFLFTSVIFVTYDCLVERRQRLVMSSATRADAIVSSLFPSAVKDRLYEGQQQQQQQQQRERSKSGGEVTNEIRQFLNPDGTASSGGGGVAAFDDRDDAAVVSPIADLYPATTIMFADVAGFTAWSSDRCPKDVFLLLETIYGRWDAIANRRGVFKVETIGDCYVAVTGIPRPQDKHALIMVNFARACLTALPLELRGLIPALGPDTMDLAVRIGCHSGPVTAGVLRGDRARFQLFGDSVNTASRIESNGQRNRIHVSQDTANLLIAAGKSHWVTKREDTVVAKGKGEMQTYWVDAKSGGDTKSELGTTTNGAIVSSCYNGATSLSMEDNNTSSCCCRNSAGQEKPSTREENQRIPGTDTSVVGLRDTASERRPQSPAHCDNFSGSGGGGIVKVSESASTHHPPNRNMENWMDHSLPRASSSVSKGVTVGSNINKQGTEATPTGIPVTDQEVEELSKKIQRRLQGGKSGSFTKTEQTQSVWDFVHLF